MGFRVEKSTGLFIAREIYNNLKIENQKSRTKNRFWFCTLHPVPCPTSRAPSNVTSALIFETVVLDKSFLLI